MSEESYIRYIKPEGKITFRRKTANRNERTINRYISKL